MHSEHCIMDLTNAFLLVIIITFIYLAYTSYSNKQSEHFTNIDQTEIYDSCKNMKPSDFINIISNGDLTSGAQKIKKICKIYNIDPSLFINKNNYPKIASYLVSKKYLNLSCSILN